MLSFMTKTKTTTKTKVAVALSAGAIVAAAGFAGAFMAKEHPETWKAFKQDLGIKLGMSTSDIDEFPDFHVKEVAIDIRGYLNALIESMDQEGTLEDRGPQVEVYFDEILQGSYQSEPGTYTLEIGNLSKSTMVKVCVDPDNLIQESNEENNCTEKYFDFDPQGSGSDKDSQEPDKTSDSDEAGVTLVEEPKDQEKDKDVSIGDPTGSDVAGGSDSVESF